MIEIDVISSPTQFGHDIRVIERLSNHNNVLLLDGMHKLDLGAELPVTCHLDQVQLSDLWDRLGELGYGHRPVKLDRFNPKPMLNARISVGHTPNDFGFDLTIFKQRGDDKSFQVMTSDGVITVPRPYNDCESHIIPRTAAIDGAAVQDLFDQLAQLGYTATPHDPPLLKLTDKNTTTIPAVGLCPVKLRDQTCIIGKNWYNVTTLIDCAKGLPVCESCADVFDISYNKWRDLVSINDFRNHMARTLNADLSYPVILSPEGEVMDGMHRIVKALITGEPVKWVKLTEMPKPDGVNEDD